MLRLRTFASLRADVRTSVSDAPPSSVSTPATTDAPVPGPLAAAPERTSRAHRSDRSPHTVLAAVWAAVALALALHLAWGAWSVRRIVARARPLDDPSWQTPLYEIADRLGLDAAPRLLRSDDVKMPFAAGLLSSTIVLPAESDEWSAERRSAVLIHELAHVRRRDLIGHTLGRLACALYWFHPARLDRRPPAPRRERARVRRPGAVFGARPSDYAEHLLDIVTCVRDHDTPAVALAMAHRSEFEGRMLAILDPELRRREPRPAQTAALVGGLAALALVVGAAAPVARTSEPTVQGLAADSSAEATAGPSHADGLPGADVDPNPDAADPDTGIVHSTSARALSAPTRESLREASNALASAQTSVAPVRKAMRDAAGTLRSLAADTAAHADQRAEVLAKMLRTDTSAEVRRVAAWGLHDYGDIRVAVDALVAALAGDANADVREMAAWSLAEAEESSAAAGALTKALRQDKDSSVRRTATWALGEVGDASAVEALAGLLTDANAETREAGRVVHRKLRAVEGARRPADRPRRSRSRRPPLDRLGALQHRRLRCDRRDRGRLQARDRRRGADRPHPGARRDG